MLAPLLSLALTALEPSSFWSEVAPYVLPRAIRDTAILLAGVALVVIVLGVGSAWLVTAYAFPGRRAVEMALVLPLAVPTYVVAFAYLDLLHPVGPVQSGLRTLLGYGRPSDLTWFPEVRSPGMCALLLGLVLYPYVYLPTRAMFLGGGSDLADAARSLGASRWRLFSRVELPLARPGIVAGASLALLETMNDVGASEFLGVRTLTVSAYATWVNRSDLPGAAQLSLLALLVVVAIVAAERWARGRRDLATSGEAPAREVLTGGKAAAALALAALPVALGFAAPAVHLAIEAGRRISASGVSTALAGELLATIRLSAVATAAIVGLALLVACGARLRPSPSAIATAMIAALGYGVPGVLLAVGLLAPLAGLDAAIHVLVQRLAGIDIGLLVLGSGIGLVYAYTARFLAVAIGSMEAGLARIPLDLDDACRGLGARSMATLGRIHLPLAGTAIASAALLVFVDCMKELPATLLLRPFNVETLATHLYGEAARGTYEDGAVAALLIVAVGLLPLALLLRLGRDGPAGRASTGPAGSPHRPSA